MSKYSQYIYIFVLLKGGMAALNTKIQVKLGNIHCVQEIHLLYVSDTCVYMKDMEIRIGTVLSVFKTECL